MSDVIPITPTHQCASCKAQIYYPDIFEGHTDKCMQPEIRMRRLEREVVTLRGALTELLHFVTGNPGGVILKDTHGSSKEPTEPSADGISAREHEHERQFWENFAAADCGTARPNARPAESERAASAGAEPGRAEPERPA